jgi:hypothetical protein
VWLRRRIQVMVHVIADERYRWATQQAHPTYRSTHCSHMLVHCCLTSAALHAIMSASLK